MNQGASLFVSKSLGVNSNSSKHKVKGTLDSTQVTALALLKTHQSYRGTHEVKMTSSLPTTSRLIDQTSAMDCSVEQL